MPIAAASKVAASCAGGMVCPLRSNSCVHGPGSLKTQYQCVCAQAP